MSAAERVEETSSRRLTDTHDPEAIVEEWMALHLLTERQLHHLLRGPLARRLRGLRLRELDVITQLHPAGQHPAEIATMLQVTPEDVRPLINHLVRQRFLSREGRGATAMIRRSEEADQLILMLREAQAELVARIFRRIPPEFQNQTMELLAAMRAGSEEGAPVEL
ncbi:MAG: hypothetical protein ACRENY_08860 [Candidatus Dormibacteria bacterium]